MFISLSEIRVHRIHCEILSGVTVGQQLRWAIAVRPNNFLAVRYDDSYCASGPQYAQRFTQQPSPLLEIKMLEHVFTKNAVEGIVGKRPWPTKVHETLHVIGVVTVDIKPMIVGLTARTAAKI